VVAFWTLLFGFTVTVGGTLTAATFRAVVTGRYGDFNRVVNGEYLPVNGIMDILPMTLMPFAMLAIAAAIWRYQWRYTADERRRLASFICVTCEATPVGQAGNIVA